MYHNTAPSTVRIESCTSEAPSSSTTLEHIVLTESSVQPAAPNSSPLSCAQRRHCCGVLVWLHKDCNVVWQVPSVVMPAQSGLHGKYGGAESQVSMDTLGTELR